LTGLVSAGAVFAALFAPLGRGASGARAASVPSKGADVMMELSRFGDRLGGWPTLPGPPLALMSSRLTLEGGERSGGLTPFAELLFEVAPSEVSKGAETAGRAGTVTLPGGSSAVALASELSRPAFGASGFAASALGMLTLAPSFASCFAASCFAASLLGASFFALSPVATSGFAASALVNSLLARLLPADAGTFCRDAGARFSAAFSAVLSAGLSVLAGAAPPVLTGVRSATELSSSALALEGSSAVFPDAAPASPPNNLERNPITVAWRRYVLESGKPRQPTRAQRTLVPTVGVTRTLAGVRRCASCVRAAAGRMCQDRQETESASKNGRSMQHQTHARDASRQRWALLARSNKPQQTVLLGRLECAARHRRCSCVGAPATEAYSHDRVSPSHSPETIRASATSVLHGRVSPVVGAPGLQLYGRQLERWAARLG
jgi:hypothetical protein